MTPLGLSADPNNNGSGSGSGSPISLLWAHQLRREHAVIVAQLEEIKELHPSSASELKKLVVRTEKAEAAGAELKKELVEVRSALREMAGDVEVLRRREKEGEERKEGFRVEVQGLRELLIRQRREFSALVDEVQKVQRQVEEVGNGEVLEQKLLQNEDEVLELRSRIQVLERKIGDAVTVVKDSVGYRKSDGAITA